jgi:nitroreductase
MEDALELIYGRRSVRRYTDQPVPEELILRILEAGRWSPTAGDLNPWRMIVIRGENKDKLEELTRKRAVYMGTRRDMASTAHIDENADPAKRERARAALAKFYRTGGFMTMGFRAPVIIVMLGHLGGAAWEDVPACIQNMLLEAHSLGLGCCWYPAELGERSGYEWKTILEIPGIAEYAVVAWFSIGWPAESPKPRPRKPLDEVVYWEKFGNTRKLPEVPLTGKYELQLPKK